MSYVFQPSRRRNGKAVKSKTWWGAYRLDGQAKETRVSLRTTHKRVAEQKLMEIVRQAELEAAGITIPKPLKDAAAKPLLEHLADYTEDQRRRGLARRHVLQTESRIRRVSESAGWARLGDISADGFTAWRNRQAELSPKTLNEYLSALHAFCNRLRRWGRIPANPLDGIEKAKQAGRQEERRALSDDEMKRLLAVAGKYAPLYLAGVHTGLRAGELKALEWGDVHLDSPRPFLSVRASTTKNKKDAIIWLVPELVEALRSIKPEGVAESRRVFYRFDVRNRRFREHLAAAGIPERDEQGRVVCLHCLRHTMCTNLHRSGVTMREAQELMRHSDVRLTSKVYTDATALPLAEAMDKLPTFTADPGAESQDQVKTGTDDAAMRTVDSATQGDSGKYSGTGRGNRLLRELPCMQQDETIADKLKKGKKIGVTGFEPAASTSRT